MSKFTEAEYRVTGVDKRSFKPHNDTAIEIIQTWSSGGHFLIGDHIYPIEPGAVYLINAVEIHCSNPIDFNSYNRSKIIVDLEYFNKLMENIGLLDIVNQAISEDNQCFYRLNLNAKTPYLIDSLFKECIDAFNCKDDFSEAIMSSIVIRILILLFTNRDARVVDQNKNDRILNLVMMHINNKISQAQNISLDEICNETHISKYYLCHLFKRTTGLSVMQYTNNLRLTQAKKLLINTNMKIQDIALSLGFSSSTFFCKFFKNSVGCPPAQYRNKHATKH